MARPTSACVSHTSPSSRLSAPRLPTSSQSAWPVRELSGHDAEWWPKCRIQAFSCWIKLGLSIGLSVLVVFYWTEVDKNAIDFTPGGYQCSSDLKISFVQRLESKGIAVDDSTFGCPTELPSHWPNTDQRIKMLRLFRSSQPDWDDAKIYEFATAVSRYAQSNGARVLVGTQITCDEDADDHDWKHTLNLLMYLQPRHVLGLAVGNELDLLHTKKGVTSECIHDLWNGYLLRKVQSRMKDLRAMEGFEQVPVTSVFTGSVIWSSSATPFMDTDFAKVNTFFTDVLSSGEKHWVFTFNFYPYFDPTLSMDPDGVHCKIAVKKCTCFDTSHCLNLKNMIQARNKMKQLTGNDDDRFWVGELGWSAPLADTLGEPMRSCRDFSSYTALYEYYAKFLNWDLKLGGVGLTPPEIVFYFTVRDSANFGHAEHFGLVELCGDGDCKLQKSRIGNDARENSSGIHTDAGISFAF